MDETSQKYRGRFIRFVNNNWGRIVRPQEYALSRGYFVLGTLYPGDI
jgi:hypothetical protein